MSMINLGRDYNDIFWVEKNSSELHDTSLALIDIPEWREGLWREGRVGGERHTFYMWDYSKCLSKDPAMARAQTF